MRTDICKWYQSCLVCVTHQAGRAVQPPLTPIPVYRVRVNVIQFPKLYLLTTFATSDQNALTIAKLFVERCHKVPAQLSDRGANIMYDLRS